MQMPFVHPSIVFYPVTHRQQRPIKKLGLVGAGDIVQHRILPAIRSNGYGFEEIVVCSSEPTSPLADLDHTYHCVTSPSNMPLHALDKAGVLSGDTLWLVVTPSAYHIFYALQLASLGCRVAVEKPLAANYYQTLLLKPFATNGYELYPIDHKLFNPEPLAFIEKCRTDASILKEVDQIHGVFYEEAGFNFGRQQEETISDIQWHLFAPTIGVFRTLGERFDVTIDRVQVSTHRPDPQRRFQSPNVWTASRIEGRLLWNGQQITFDFHQVKGAPSNEKRLRLLDGQHNTVAEIDMGESGFMAHARILEALTHPIVDMRHTLEDAIAVMQIVEISREMARRQPEVETYPFGSLPAFLQAEGRSQPCKTNTPSSMIF